MSNDFIVCNTLPIDALLMVVVSASNARAVVYVFLYVYAWLLGAQNTITASHSSRHGGLDIDGVTRFGGLSCTQRNRC